MCASVFFHSIADVILGNSKKSKIHSILHAVITSALNCSGIELLQYMNCMILLYIDESNAPVEHSFFPPHSLRKLKKNLTPFYLQFISTPVNHAVLRHALQALFFVLSFL